MGREDQYNKLNRILEDNDGYNKTRFVSRVSHDIRTSIGAIQNLVEFAREDYEDKEKLMKDLDQIERSCYSLLSFFDNAVKSATVDTSAKVLMYEASKQSDYVRQRKKARTRFEEKIGGKILLVEDNEINAKIVMRMMERFGIECDYAYDGLRGMELFNRSKPDEYDMIIMDMEMPVMDGYDATRHIRALERSDSKRIPIVAMTADAFPDSKRKAIECGVNEYLTKPLDMMELNLAIRRMKEQRVK